MPSYKEALKFAQNEKYDDSIGKLRDTMVELDNNVGKKTNLHLYI